MLAGCRVLTDELLASANLYFKRGSSGIRDRIANSKILPVNDRGGRRNRNAPTARKICAAGKYSSPPFVVKLANKFLAQSNSRYFAGSTTKLSTPV